MTVTTIRREVFIDPSSKAYYENRLFDGENRVLNRDDTLAPFIRLLASEKEKGNTLKTADYLVHERSVERADYYSLGVLDNYKALSARQNVRLRAFIIFEPPVVDPRLYDALPDLTAMFECVYVHNVVGDGYSLRNVQQSKLRKLYWPQPRKEVVSYYWERNERQNRIVVINGNHRPARMKGELYSKRIEAMVALMSHRAVDLYGRGWERWWSRASMWLPYWRNRKKLLSIYKGACDSKYEVLSQYMFCLCFENMAIQGYVTEKIFDCFYAGTIPLYLGATNIESLIPCAAYIDCRRFDSFGEIWTYVQKLSEQELDAMKNAGREFVESDAGKKYFNSLNQIFGSPAGDVE